MGPFTQTSMINPIDRLYSMQNSYFRPDELGYSDGNGSGGGGGSGPGSASSIISGSNMVGGLGTMGGSLGQKDITDN